jgi:hypothetical protein
MSKLDTYRRISKILVIKCDKAETEKESLDSFNKATELKRLLEQIEYESGFESLQNELAKWARSNPMVTNSEVEYLTNHGK